MDFYKRATHKNIHRFYVSPLEQDPIKQSRHGMAFRRWTDEDQAERCALCNNHETCEREGCPASPSPKGYFPKGSEESAFPIIFANDDIGYTTYIRLNKYDQTIQSRDYDKKKEQVYNVLVRDNRLWAAAQSELQVRPISDVYSAKAYTGYTKTADGWLPIDNPNRNMTQLERLIYDECIPTRK